MRKKNPCTLLSFVIISCMQLARCNDISPLAFGSLTRVQPAAFGDFNADELTDLFVITEDKKTVKILLASTKEPFFVDNKILNCTLPAGHDVTSVAPGDFDGDALMDFLVTSVTSAGDRTHSHVFINYGNLNNVSCSAAPVITMNDEPLVIDYDQNMIADLFGQNNKSENVFWLFSKNRSALPHEIPLNMTGNTKFVVRFPHSHAFVDVNGDNSPDLYLTGTDGFGIWLYDNDLKNFVFSETIPYPNKLPDHQIGQNLFMDIETADSLHAIVPVCDGDKECSRSAIYVLVGHEWFNLNVSFTDHYNHTWGFVAGNGRAPTDPITLRSGDFNNDGYVDMLATLQLVSDRSFMLEKRTFLLENVPCADGACAVKRTFQIKWDSFGSWNLHAVMGAFYDFMQDGILDIIFVRLGADKRYYVCAFKNSLDYDANFVKVMVISGLLKSKDVDMPTALLSPKSTFGCSLAGPKIQYRTTTQDGNPQTGVAVQLPQSAHFPLHLPFTIFGLGRTPNFVEDLTIGIFNQTHTWNQIIPNSQMVVVPYPPDVPSRWRAQLFVTPSKIIWQTVFALAGTCAIIAVIIGLLHWKERREDRIEKLQEAHRFHFDAM